MGKDKLLVGERGFAKKYFWLGDLPSLLKVEEILVW